MTAPSSRSSWSWPAKHRIHLVAGGMPEKSADPARPYNTSLLVSPSGSIVARYRKIHLFDVDLPDGTVLKESAGSSAGERALRRARGRHPPRHDGLLRPPFPRAISPPWRLRRPHRHRSGGLHPHHRQGPLARAAPRPGHREPGVRPCPGPDRDGTRAAARPTARASSWTRGATSWPSAGRERATPSARLDFAYQDRVRASLPCLKHRRL